MIAQTPTILLQWWLWLLWALEVAICQATLWTFQIWNISWKIAKSRNQTVWLQSFVASTSGSVHRKQRPQFLHCAVQWWMMSQLALCWQITCSPCLRMCQKQSGTKSWGVDLPKQEIWRQSLPPGSSLSFQIIKQLEVHNNNLKPQWCIPLCQEGVPINIQC